MHARRLSGGGADTTAPPLVSPAAAAAAAGGTFTTTATSNSSGRRGGSFDANMVIIMAALLCVLILALGLNSLVRCCLHCARRLSSPPSAPVSSSSPAPAGLKRKALRRIPVEVYGESSNGGTAEGRSAAAECAICLGEFAGGEKVRVLPRCRHGFHVRCIDAWLAAHSSCPNCRASLLIPDAGAGEDGGGRVRR